MIFVQLDERYSLIRRVREAEAFALTAEARHQHETHEYLRELDADVRAFEAAVERHTKWRMTLS